MKKLIFFIIILNLIFLSKTKCQEKQFVVVIDAGHGGKDSGAIGYYGLKEKQITLNMALSVKALINSYDKEIKVILTRRKDIFIPLEKRCEISNLFKPDLFLSIHCDANLNKRAKGASVYLQTNLKSKNYPIENYKESVIFGMILQEILKKDLKMKSKKILFNNYQVLRNTLELSPSVLIETGYISNKQEATYYKTVGQKAISYAILKAILKYKNKKTCKTN